VKKSAIQYIFARSWPRKAYFSAAAAFGVWSAVVACQPSMAMFGDWEYLLLFVVSVVVAPILAFFLSLLLIPLGMAQLYYWRGRLNGAPFKVGDRVRILVGQHRGRITRVYSMWQGDSVRVELGKEAEHTHADIFEPTQLVRETDAEPGAAPNGRPATPLGNSGVTQGPPSAS
jgi:hypothetical protein